jgi:hypothetical protein
MSHAMVEFWLIALMGISSVAMVSGFALSFSDQWQTMTKTFRIGFILLTMGLGVQTIRSLHFLQFGTYPIDEYFPTWIVKDIGFCLMVYSMTVASIRHE